MDDFLKLIYLFERERVRVHMGGEEGQREGERISGRFPIEQEA